MTGGPSPFGPAGPAERPAGQEPASSSAPAPAAGPSGASSPTRDEPPTRPSGAVAAPPVIPPVMRPAVGSRAVPPLASPEAPRPRKRWWRVLRVILLLILLPLIAMGIGLLIAWIVHEVRGDAVHPGAAPGSSASASGASKPAAAPSAEASAPARPAVTVPADWIAEAQPPAGLSYRHPAGWLRRTATPEVLRIVPEAPGSLSPGVEAVGAGFETGTDPARAAQDFATRNYGAQPGFAVAPATAVAGQHPGEQQEIVTYRRSGVPVRMVIHGYAEKGRIVVTLGRSLASQPARAATLQAQLEASLRVTG